jgi:hypothetical protein
MTAVKNTGNRDAKRPRRGVPIWPDWHLYERLKAQIPRTLDHLEYERRLRQAAEKAGV